MKILIIYTVEGANDRNQFIIDSTLISNQSVRSAVEKNSSLKGCPLTDELIQSALTKGKHEKTLSFILVDEYVLVKGVNVPFLQPA